MDIKSKLRLYPKIFQFLCPLQITFWIETYLCRYALYIRGWDRRVVTPTPTLPWG